jgi:uncharacterized protein YaaQ
MENAILDRLVFLTISGSQADPFMKRLTREGFQFTLINSTSQMMQEPVICLMVGFFHDRLNDLLGIVREECKAYRKFIPTQNILPGELTNLPMVEAQLGGARVFMMNVERFEQL